MSPNYSQSKARALRLLHRLTVTDPVTRDRKAEVSWLIKADLPENAKQIVDAWEFRAVVKVAARSNPFTEHWREIHDLNLALDDLLSE